jgi:hypothetical protein
MDIVIILIVLIAIIVVWVNIVNQKKIQLIQATPLKDANFQFINGIVQVSNSVYSNSTQMSCFFNNSDIISLDHTQGIAIFGNFKSTDHISFYAEEINSECFNNDGILTEIIKELPGRVSNLNVSNNVCVILTGNQALTTYFRNDLIKRYDLKNSSFKIIEITNLDVMKKYKLNAYIRGNIPVLTTVKICIPQLINLPFKDATKYKT